MKEPVTKFGDRRLGAQIGVDPEFGQSVVYVEEWLEAMKDGGRAIFGAALEAQEAVDYIMERPAQAGRIAAG
ncbi:hypothetical protein Jann_2618 [Jannaschia sp. CCS1]|nr:hypothetical protein Jann_2618 [Jannaschia sp. CCS1]